MKKVCKYSLSAAILVFLLSQSVYFEDLKAVREQRRREAFNAAEYAGDLWLNQLPAALDKAVDVKELIELFNTNMSQAIERYGKAPGVSRVYAYLLKGEGTILSIDSDGLKVSVKEPQTNPDVVIETGFYIPGNAVRDASGLIDVSKFSDTMKFNEIGSEINKIIIRDVIRPLPDKKPAVGGTIKFFGATQVAQDAAQENPLQLVGVIPIRLELE
jgi:predicted lipoprotein